MGEHFRDAWLIPCDFDAALPCVLHHVGRTPQEQVVVLRSGLMFNVELRAGGDPARNALQGSIGKEVTSADGLPPPAKPFPASQSLVL
jgi:hypothetical protein